LIVRRGWFRDPSEESEPVVATWNVDAMRANLSMDAEPLDRVLPDALLRLPREEPVGGRVGTSPAATALPAARGARLGRP
jgi:hypothetical protein